MTRPHLFVEQFETVPKPDFVTVMVSAAVCTACLVGAAIIAFYIWNGVL